MTLQQLLGAGNDWIRQNHAESDVLIALVDQHRRVRITPANHIEFLEFGGGTKRVYIVIDGNWRDAELNEPIGQPTTSELPSTDSDEQPPTGDDPA